MLLNNIQYEPDQDWQEFFGLGQALGQAISGLALTCLRYKGHWMTWVSSTLSMDVLKPPASESEENAQTLPLKCHNYHFLISFSFQRHVALCRQEMVEQAQLSWFPAFQSSSLPKACISQIYTKSNLIGGL